MCDEVLCLRNNYHVFKKYHIFLFYLFLYSEVHREAVVSDTQTFTRNFVRSPVKFIFLQKFKLTVLAFPCVHLT